jgi:hypothetical protein
MMIQEQQFSRITAFPQCNFRDDFKRRLETMFKTPGVDQERDFIWNVDGDTVFVRREQLPHGKEVSLPPVGAKVRFRTLVAPKTTVIGNNGKPKKKVLVNREEFMAWLPRRLERAGLAVDTFSFSNGRTLIGQREATSEYVAKCRTMLLGDPNSMFFHTADYTGIAAVMDRDKLLIAMKDGIPSIGKCWGFGFLHINTEN